MEHHQNCLSVSQRSLIRLSVNGTILRRLRTVSLQFPLGAGDGHALAGAHADEISLEFGEGGEDIEEQLVHGIARIVERPSEGQFHAAFLKCVGRRENVPRGRLGRRIWAADVQGNCPANCSAEMSNAYSSMVSDAGRGCRLVGGLSASIYLLTVCL